jgi:putative DNA primase/helicase
MLSFVPAPDPDHRKTERLANPDLEEALKKETSGILAWLVKGYVKAANEGLIPPDGVRVATNEYKKEEDTVGRFVEERIEKFIGSEIRAGKAYETYKEWCESEGIKPKHNTTFGREIRNHLEVDTRREKVFYTNVRLKD